MYATNLNHSFRYLSPDERGGSSGSALETSPYQSLHIDDLLRLTSKFGASDLHIQSESPPMMRINGKITKVDVLSESNSKTGPEVPEGDVKRMIYDILRADHINRYETSGDLDLSYALPRSDCRFRVNVYREINGIGAVFRLIPNEIPTVESLHLPPVIKRIVDMPRGLVLVTGITGSGKSTTLASLVDIINTNQEKVIISIEDPIEYVHKWKNSKVTQREVGSHTDTFREALRASLREDPDVIVVGEMRDLETIETAITAAETGHLVFATVHTPNAPESVDRLIDVFPASQKEQIRVQLSNNLKAILSQQLLPTADGTGRVPAVEVMFANPAIKHMIRKNNTHQITSTIQTSGKEGMQTMDAALAALVQKGLVKEEDARLVAQDVDEFNKLVTMRPDTGRK